MDIHRNVMYSETMYRLADDPAGQTTTEYDWRDLSREQLTSHLAAQTALIEDLQVAHDTLVTVISAERRHTATLTAAWQRTQAQVQALNRKIFGQTSERQPRPGSSGEARATGGSPEPQAPADAGLEVPHPASNPTGSTPRRPRGQQPGQPGHGRTVFDLKQSGLPVRHQYVEAPDAMIPCPQCGEYPEQAGTEDSQLVDFVVQLQLVVVHRARYRRTCGCFPPTERPTSVALTPDGPPETGVPSQGVVTSAALTDGSETTRLAESPVEVVPEAEPDPNGPSASETELPPERGVPAIPARPLAVRSTSAVRSFTAPRPLTVVPRGRFTLEFVVQLLAWKYIWGVPLHRLRQVWRAQDAHLAAGTLVGTLQAVEPLLRPLYEALCAINRREPWWHADETSWKVFVDTVGKKGYRWWLWVFRGPQSTVFLLSPTRGGQVPRDHLQPLPEGDALPSWWGKILVSDYYSGYRSMLEGIRHAWCWAHIRRKFFDTGKAHAADAAWSLAWLKRIHELYRLRRRRRQAAPDSAAWGEADHALRAWVQAAERQWTEELKQYDRTSRRGKVLATVQREWAGLILFLEFPQIPLDNNEAERLLRTPVVGRKNYYGSRAEWSGHLAAMMWTLWATALQMGRNPLGYLREYLTAVAENHHEPLPADRLARFVPTLKPESG